jgi:hypothetical protein
MNRILTYLLLFVFLLYQAGYYLFYLTLKHRADLELTENSDNKVLNKDFIIKSIPLSLAYQQDQKDFLSVMQVIEADGKYYRIIKQRYANDTLHIIYMADKSRENLHTSLTEWVNSISQQSSQDKQSLIKDGLEKNYMPNNIHIELIIYFEENSGFKYSYVPDLLINPMDTLKPPPESGLQA